VKYFDCQLCDKICKMNTPARGRKRLSDATDGRANRTCFEFPFPAEEHTDHRRSFNSDTISDRSINPPRHVAFIPTDDTFHPHETSGLYTAPPRECSLYCTTKRLKRESQRTYLAVVYSLRWLRRCDWSSPRDQRVIHDLDWVMRV